jgi:hypothetical protein
MSSARQIRVGRIVVGAFLAEATVLTFFFLFLWVATLAGVPELVQPMTPFDYADAMVGSFAAMFLFTLWVCRRVESRFVLHGVLLAVVAILMFVALAVAVNRTFYEPALYWVAHGLKIAGGIAGGVVAERRFARRAFGRGNDLLVAARPDARQ